MAEISIKAETLFHLGVFNFTNSYLLSLIVMGIFVSLTIWLKDKLALIPGKMQSILELLTEQILQLMDTILGSRFLSEKYFPLVATIFLFVLLSNWLGLLPGTGSLGLTHEIYKHGETEHVLIPLLRAPTSDLNFTIALAVITVFSIQILGIMSIGFFKYVGKFINFHGPINFFVGILELIGEISKIVSLSFRLFGNIFAGEVLLTVVLFLVPYIVPLPFLGLEIFVGFVQALVFSMLTLVFLKIATAEHH